MFTPHNKVQCVGFFARHTPPCQCLSEAAGPRLAETFSPLLFTPGTLHTVRRFPIPLNYSPFCPARRQRPRGLAARRARARLPARGRPAAPRWAPPLLLGPRRLPTAPPPGARGKMGRQPPGRAGGGRGRDRRGGAGAGGSSPEAPPTRASFVLARGAPPCALRLFGF